MPLALHSGSRIAKFCRMAGFVLTVVFLLPIAPTAISQTVDVTFDDLRSGYWLNFEDFKSLYVSWRLVRFPHENQVRRQEKSWENETPEQQAALRKASGRREEQSEFWSDRIAFQVRTPAVLVPDRESPDKKFDFPKVAARQNNLETDFKDIAVYNYNGNLGDGVKFWNGVFEGVPQGAVLSGLRPDSPGRWLPPLALSRSIAGFELHPFDAFYSNDYVEARVVERVYRDGLSLYIVEKVVLDPSGPARLKGIVEQAGGNVDELQLFDVYRAWIDSSRGCLPIRIEITPRIIYQGRVFDDVWGYGPKEVIESENIEKISNGGFYPFRVRSVYYGIDVREQAPLYFKQIIDGGMPKRRAVPDSEQQWVAQTVDASRDMAGLFGFEFPPDMAYFDFRTSKVVGRSYDAAKGGREGSRRVTAVRGGGLLRTFLIGVNVLLIVVLLAIFAVRWWHRSRA